MGFISAHASWDCPPVVLWDSESRLADIDAVSKQARRSGDVSAPEARKNRGNRTNPNDTAPALEDCKPLEVNNDTRWKAGVMKSTTASGNQEEENDDDMEQVLKKALLVMNKLSVTKFEKLSDAFIETGIGKNEACLAGAIGLVVTKAQNEPHFASMYAELCLKLSRTPMEGLEDEKKKGKRFKKLLLTRCQEEFEQDSATKIKTITKDMTDEDEISYHATLVKKSYLGHMRSLENFTRVI
jgi:translation initiation factor 4G